MRMNIYHSDLNDMPWLAAHLFQLLYAHEGRLSIAEYHQQFIVLDGPGELLDEIYRQPRLDDILGLQEIVTLAEQSGIIVTLRTLQHACKQGTVPGVKLIAGTWVTTKLNAEIILRRIKDTGHPGIRKNG